MEHKCKAVMQRDGGKHCAECGRYTKRGGKRPGAGRKPKYPGIKTVRIVRTVPVWMVEELDKWVEERVKG